MRGLTLAVASALCAASCGGNALAPTTVQPLPGSSSGNSSARIRLTNFMAFGDSITWGEDGRNDASETLGRIRPQVRVTSPYPSILASDLQTRYTGQILRVDNDGCRGEAANSADAAPPECPGAGLDPLHRFDLLITIGGYQSVLLMEGANDIGASYGISGAIGALRDMVENAKSHGLRVFLATIPPEQQNANPAPSARNHPEADVLAMNGAIRSLATSEGVTLVDVYAAFPSPDTNDLYALGLLSRDGLHPLEGGYGVIAQAFFTQIVQKLELPPAVALPTREKS